MGELALILCVKWRANWVRIGTTWASILLNSASFPSSFFWSDPMTKRPFLKALLATAASLGFASVAVAQTTPIKFQLEI